MKKITLLLLLVAGFSISANSQLLKSIADIKLLFIEDSDTSPVIDDLGTLTFTPATATTSGTTTAGSLAAALQKMEEEMAAAEAERATSDAERQALEDALSAAQDDYEEALRLMIELSRRQSETANAIIRNMR